MIYLCYFSLIIYFIYSFIETFLGNLYQRDQERRHQAQDIFPPFPSHTCKCGDQGAIFADGAVLSNIRKGMSVNIYDFPLNL